MRNLSYKLFFIAATTSLVSCRKDVGIDQTLDYRSKLEGTYNCLVTKSERIADSINFDTTYSTQIKVEVDYLNAYKNSIMINGEFFTELKNVSNHYECDDNGSQYKRKNAKFINDSLYYYVVNGSNGSATSYEYKGKK